MGKSLAVAAMVAAGASAAGSLLGGIQQNQAANEQASLANQQAEERARLEARENMEAEKRQKVAFLTSGVSLEGSPLLVLQETKRRGDENIGNILDSGRAQASSLRASGRSALIGGLFEGSSTIAGASGK